MYLQGPCRMMMGRVSTGGYTVEWCQQHLWNADAQGLESCQNRFAESLGKWIGISLWAILLSLSAPCCRSLLQCNFSHLPEVLASWFITSLFCLCHRCIAKWQLQRSKSTPFSAFFFLGISPWQWDLLLFCSFPSSYSSVGCAYFQTLHVGCYSLVLYDVSLSITCKACPHLSQFEATSISYLDGGVRHVDEYRRSTLIASSLLNRLVPTVNRRVNLSHDKPHASSEMELETLVWLCGWGNFLLLSAYSR